MAKRTGIVARLIEWKQATVALMTSPELSRFGFTLEGTFPLYADQLIEAGSFGLDKGLRLAKKAAKAKAEETPAKKVAAKPAAPTAKKSKVAKKASAAKKSKARNAVVTVEVVASDKRPPVPEAIAKVLKPGESIDFDQMHDRLKKKGWLPNSRNFMAYLHQICSSSHRENGPIERDPKMDKGFYRLRVVKTAKKPVPVQAKKVESKAPTPKKSVVVVAKKPDIHLNGSNAHAA